MIYGERFALVCDISGLAVTVAGYHLIVADERLARFESEYRLRQFFVGVQIGRYEQVVAIVREREWIFCAQVILSLE